MNNDVLLSQLNTQLYTFISFKLANTEVAFYNRGQNLWMKSQTIRNSTDFMPVVHFTSLMQCCHQVASSLLSSSGR